MCIRNRAVSLIYKILIVLVAGFGIFSYSGLQQGAFSADAFKYYTILSNCLVFLFYIFASIYVARRLKKKGVTGYATYAPQTKGGIVMAITVTMLVYWFVLFPQSFTMGTGGGELRNYIVHLIVPLMVIIDWALFDKKGYLRFYDPIVWLVIPLAYYALVLLGRQFRITYYGGSLYPYFFINSDELGWPTVLRNLGLFALAFLVLGFILFGIDKLLGRHVKQTLPEKTVYRRGTPLETGPDVEAQKFESTMGTANEAAPNKAPVNDAPTAPEATIVQEDTPSLGNSSVGRTVDVTSFEATPLDNPFNTDKP